MLSLTIKDGKKVIYRGRGEGVVDIIAAIADQSQSDKFYLMVRRAVMLMEEQDLPDTEFIKDLKYECGIL